MKEDKELMSKIVKFENDFRKTNKTQTYNETLEQLVVDFQKKFLISEIANLPLEGYVRTPQKEKETFCNWVDDKLYDLGSIDCKSGPKIFGVYFKVGDYTHTKKFGRTTPDAFKNVKKAIADLLNAAQDNDKNAILKNPISPMYKGKLLFVYHPDKYLNIYSKKSLLVFFEKLNIAYQENEDVLNLRAKLLDFKKKHDIMKTWTIHEFMVFLYHTYNPNNSKMPTLDQWFSKYN